MMMLRLTILALALGSVSCQNLPRAEVQWQEGKTRTVTTLAPQEVRTVTTSPKGETTAVAHPARAARKAFNTRWEALRLDDWSGLYPGHGKARQQWSITRQKPTRTTQGRNSFPTRGNPVVPTANYAESAVADLNAAVQQLHAPR